MRPVINPGFHDTNRFTDHCWSAPWQDISPPKGTPHLVTQPRCTHLFLSREEDMSYGEFRLHSPSPYPGSNREPSACEADALTTRLRWLTNVYYRVFLSFIVLSNFVSPNAAINLSITWFLYNVDPFSILQNSSSCREQYMAQLEIVSAYTNSSILTDWSTNLNLLSDIRILIIWF